MGKILDAFAENELLNVKD